MAYWKLLVSWCVSARTSGIFASSKHTISVANPKVGGAVLRSSGKRVTGPVSPSLSGNGQSRPVTEHRPPAWEQLGFLSKIDDRVHIPVMLSAHVALGSVFNIGLSKLKAWLVLPSGEDNRGVAP